MSAEQKLGQSLDSIIEANRSKFTTKKRGDKPPRGDKPKGPRPTGMRIDGARKPLRIQGVKPQNQAPPQRPPRAQRGGAGQDVGLGVRAAGIKKRSNRPAAYTYDEDMDTGDYGAPPPRRENFQGGGGGRGRGGGGGNFRQNVPRGNSDDFWSHDLYNDVDQAPARRVHAMAARPSARPNGVTLTVSNLDYTVTDKDIKELFETCGQLLGGFIHYDNSGRSEGLATIIYQRRADAEKAIGEYNGVKLDGKELIIEYAAEEEQPMAQLSSGKTLVRRIDNDGPAPNSFKRAISALPVQGMGGDMPVRSMAGPRGGGMGGGDRMGGDRMGGDRPRMGGDRMGGRGMGRVGGGSRPGGRGGPMAGRLRSTVGGGGATRSRADLDADLDGMMQE